MKKNLLRSAAIILAATGGPAMAADLPVYNEPVAAVPVVTPFTWTGFYVGAHAGYVWGDSDWSDRQIGEEVGDLGDFDPADPLDPTGQDPDFETYYWPADDEPLPGLTECDTACLLNVAQEVSSYDEDDDDLEGWFGGAQIGYNYQTGMFVLGAEADISFGDVSSSGDTYETWDRLTQYDFSPPSEVDFDAGNYAFGSNLDIYEGFEAATSYDVDIEMFGTLRARAGVAFGRFLPYITGGLAWGKVSIDGSGYIASTGGEYSTNGGATTTAFPGTYVATADFDDDDWRIGWTLGGGVEVAVTDHWSIKGEYLYVDLGDKDIHFSDGNGNESSSDVDINMQTVKLGVNYRF